MPETSRRRAPRAFVVSVAFGAAGLAVLLLGLVLANDALVLSGVGAGCISLVAALVWREELILAWHAQRRRRGGSS